MLTVLIRPARPKPLMIFRRISARDKPETLARNEVKHAQQLKRAMAIAMSRASRSSEMIRTLLRSATVQAQPSASVSSDCSTQMRTMDQITRVEITRLSFADRHRDGDAHDDPIRQSGAQRAEVRAAARREAARGPFGSRTGQTSAQDGKWDSDRSGSLGARVGSGGSRCRMQGTARTRAIM